VAKDLSEFIFKKDLWFLDFCTAITFAACMSAFTQIMADPIEAVRAQVVLAGVVGICSYFAASVLALPLKGVFPFIKNWAWIGIGGAHIQTLVRRYLIYPNFWPDFVEVEPSKYIFTEVVPWIIANWVLWAFLGCLCIFSIRLIIYFLTQRRNSFS
jgi:hypothetical protein